jgi:isopenicillin-N N-acyltransferase-like protein
LLLFWFDSQFKTTSKKLAISEIGVSFPDPSFGKESRVGVPFIFMLREILQFDSTLEEATHRMKTKRSEFVYSMYFFSRF